jgi:BNR repeat protein
MIPSHESSYHSSLKERNNMASIEIASTGLIDQRESAFPQAVQLPDNDVLCSYSVGGGAEVTGGTDWSRSTDGGESWNVAGTLLPPDPSAGLANFLKLSLSADGKRVYAYGAEIDHDLSKPFGERDAHAVLCQSTDCGNSWSPPTPVPMDIDCPLEVSCAALPLGSGRLLAPAATLASADTLGARVIVAISDDGGATWPRHATVFNDPEGKRGFFEHKFSLLPGGDVLATAWTVTLGDYRDLANSFCISKDGGLTWGPAQTTGIQGQTLSTLPLAPDRLLVLYNRRYGQQAIVSSLVACTETTWTLLEEQLLYDAQAFHQRSDSTTSGIDELNTFAFGFPTAIRLADGTILATHWCVERGKCGIRWTRLRVE